jgi:hypothetical protein
MGYMTIQFFRLHSDGTITFFLDKCLVFNFSHKGSQTNEITLVEIKFKYYIKEKVSKHKLLFQKRKTKHLIT